LPLAWLGHPEIKSDRNVEIGAIESLNAME
jgi:hypothetical protein